MPHYYVAINRPDVEAADANDAANKAVSTPLVASDTVYVKELDPSGSFFAVPGRLQLGGIVAQPDAVVTP